MPLTILKSYLSNRHHFVTIDKISSDQKPTLYGVPQGSILGPLLFLLYINDLPKSSSKLSFVLYADDTNLLLSGPDPDSIISDMNREIPKITQWLNTNKLCLNVNKTHFVIFKPGRTSLHCSESLHMNQTTVKQERCTKFLGVMLDARLKWSDHIQYIRKKISKNIGILHKLRKVLNLPTLIQLYHSFIQPYLTYCIEIWGNASQTQLDLLLKLQKRCCRILTNSPRLSPSAPMFKELGIMPINTLYKYNIGIFMYKVRMGHLPLPLFPSSPFCKLVAIPTLFDSLYADSLRHKPQRLSKAPKYGMKLFKI